MSGMSCTVAGRIKILSPFIIRDCITTKSGCKRAVVRCVENKRGAVPSALPLLHTLAPAGGAGEQSSPFATPASLSRRRSPFSTPPVLRFGLESGYAGRAADPDGYESEQEGSEGRFPNLTPPTQTVCAENGCSVRIHLRSSGRHESVDKQARRRSLCSSAPERETGRGDAGRDPARDP